MGQQPAKFFPPPTPYGSSPNVGAIGAPTQVDTTTQAPPPGPADSPRFLGGPVLQPTPPSGVDPLIKQTLPYRQGGAGGFA